MADLKFFGGPSPTQIQANNEVAAELGLPGMSEAPINQTPDVMFPENPAAQGLPPELQQIPKSLRPNSIALTVPAPEQLMSVPTGAVITNFQPQVGRQPAQQVDTPQFSKPVKAPQVSEAPSAPQADASGLLGTYDAQQKANKAIANAMAEKSFLDEAAQADLEDNIALNQLNQQKMQLEFDSAFKSRIADMENISKQLAAQNFTTAKVDSNKLWNDMGTGQKILAGLAIALGGYGGALSGKGDNKALDIINKAIDRDIEAQKFNIQNEMQSKQMKTQNLRDQASMQGTLMNTLRQKYGDDLQAEAAMRSLMLQQTQLKLQQIASQTESNTVLENAKLVNAQLEREKQMQLQAMQARIATMAALRNLGTADVHNLDPAVEASLPENIQKVIKDRRERSLPGWEGSAKDKETASKFLERVNEVQPAIDGVNRILAATKDINRVTDLQKKAEIATEIKALVGQLRLPFTGPGQLTEKEYDRLLDTIGDPTRLSNLPSWERAKLTTVLKKLEGDLDTAANASGFRRKHTVDKSKLRPY